MSFILRQSVEDRKISILLEPTGINKSSGCNRALGDICQEKLGAYTFQKAAFAMMKCQMFVYIFI